MPFIVSICFLTTWHSRMFYHLIYQALWPIYQLQLKRSYILCNWHASDFTFVYTPYWFFILVAAILGQLSFFLRQASKKGDSLQRAAQIYEQSTCATSVKQAVENLFSSSNRAVLGEESVQVALDNLLGMHFVVLFLSVLPEY